MVTCGVGIRSVALFSTLCELDIRKEDVGKTIDLELTRAEVEVLELEARLRVVPMNDVQLSDALKTALVAKKERLAKLRTLHATAGKGRSGGKDGDSDRMAAILAGRRPVLKRTVPQRPQPKGSK